MLDISFRSLRKWAINVTQLQIADCKLPILHGLRYIAAPMQLKDYYKILEVEPSATLQEIKKAYHRLAQQYHPDKNSSAEYSAAYFTEIKEAYEVLTNPSKRDYYLQSRWYQQSRGNRKFQTQPITPPLVLKQFIELDKYTSRLDNFRMDKQGLFEYMNDLLENETAVKLKEFNDQGVNDEIINIGIKISSYLDMQHAKSIAEKLYLLANSPVTKKRIDLSLQQLQRRSAWEKGKIYIVLLITIIISFLIYLISR